MAETTTKSGTVNSKLSELTWKSKFVRKSKKKKLRENRCPLPKAETEFQTFSPEVGWSAWPLLCGGGLGAGGRLLTAGTGSNSV